MSDAYDFEIPEWNRIGTMMRDLMEPEKPAVRRAPARKATSARAHGGRRLGTFSLAEFAAGTNWLNAQGFHTPLAAAAKTSSARSRLGAIKVNAFIDGANWRNALDGPQLIAPITSATADPNAGPPPSVEDFFETMKWD